MFEKKRIPATFNHPYTCTRAFKMNCTLSPDGGCFKCRLRLDRKDPVGEYSDANTLPACWPCTRGRQGLPLAVWLSYCSRRTLFRLERNGCPVKLLDKLRASLVECAFPASPIKCTCAAISIDM